MSSLPWLHPERVALLEAALAERILILDGGMGTMLQGHQLDETGFRGQRFEHGHDGAHGGPHAPSHTHRSTAHETHRSTVSTVSESAAEGEFGDARVAPPQQQDWGAIVTYVWDPCGVLLHFTQFTP